MCTIVSLIAPYPSALTIDKPSDTVPEPIERLPCEYKPLYTFDLEKDKQYRQQYGDMYFLRLAKLKPAAEKVAAEAWDGFEIGGEAATKVERVLDVRQGELCWVTGTIYMDMALKPNILDDISKDVSIVTDDKYSWLTCVSIGFQLCLRGKNTSRQTEVTRQC